MSGITKCLLNVSRVSLWIFINDIVLGFFYKLYSIGDGLERYGQN